MTTRIQSVSIPVEDQDRALRFYCDVLGCTLLQDLEVWPGARLVEVGVPGSEVSLLLLPANGEIPIAVRLGTADADAAHEALARSPQTAPLDDVLRYDFAPPMFRFTDVDGNLLIYLEEAAADAERA
jgi:catechol 2,3-dioxygenase-like lactoylglutathione lyase family enzyme